MAKNRGGIEKGYYRAIEGEGGDRGKLGEGEEGAYGKK